MDEIAVLGAGVPGSVLAREPARTGTPEVTVLPARPYSA